MRAAVAFCLVCFWAHQTCAGDHDDPFDLSLSLVAEINGVIEQKHPDGKVHFRQVVGHHLFQCSILYNILSHQNRRVEDSRVRYEWASEAYSRAALFLTPTKYTEGLLDTLAAKIGTMMRDERKLLFMLRTCKGLAVPAEVQTVVYELSLDSSEQIGQAD